jgi:hypothetical protein
VNVPALDKTGEGEENDIQPQRQETQGERHGLNIPLTSRQLGNFVGGHGLKTGWDGDKVYPSPVFLKRKKNPEASDFSFGALSARLGGTGL